MFVAYPEPEGRRFVLPENFERLQRSSTGDITTISDSVLQVVTHSPLVFGPKAPWQEAIILSIVTNQIVLPKADQLKISTRDLVKTANAFQKWPFDQEWVHGIGTLSVRIPELRFEERDYVRLGNDHRSQLTDECLLQACIPVDWTKPMAVFEAGPHDYKRLKTDASGVSRLTVKISDSRYQDRSP